MKISTRMQRECKTNAKRIQKKKRARIQTKTDKRIHRLDIKRTDNLIRRALTISIPTTSSTLQYSSKRGTSIHPGEGSPVPA